MKKAILFIMAIVMASMANAQVLYKISGKGIKNESYIVGTCHIVGASFVDSIPGAKNVLQKVDQVCGEVDNKDLADPNTMAYIQQRMMMPGDSTLLDIMTEEQHNKLRSAILDNQGLDIAEPQFAGLLKLRPLFFFINTTVLSEQMKALNSGTQANNEMIMDMYFQQEAIAAGKPCLGLETTKFQTDLLLNVVEKNFNWQEQIDNIIDGAQKLDSAKREVYKLMKCYKAMDVKAMENYFIESMKNSKDAENLVLTTRNENWSHQIPDIMAEKSTLFVVGAAHLVGDKSILKLLQDQGYTIEPVKE
ncbi:MAG: TraB/GumN family protein [Bacteroidales bacterium]|nr:TraB/GumN family protein [Bacteroidales bacterium]